MFKRARTLGTVGVVMALGLSGLAILPPIAGALEPTSVTFTLEGCRANSDPQPNQVCVDGHYTHGNLDSTGQGPSWNELDLVPHRLTTTAGTNAPALQTYDVGVAVDYRSGDKIGYDALSVPVLNLAQSSIGCVLLAVTGGGAGTQTPGTTSGDVSLTRILTVTQPAGSQCVFDYYARLAVGAHDFPGSSLHANLTSGGNKEVSIPVMRIEPQEISKDMSASLNSNHTWTVHKTATPLSHTFEDTCLAPTGSSTPVQITVTWTKAEGNTTGFHVITRVYATNPANREITVRVTDNIYTNSTLLGTRTFAAVDVPAGMSNVEVGTWAIDVPISAVADVNAPNFHDVATAVYTDKIFGVPIPGTTEATASVANDAIGVGTEGNGSAKIVDTENITGNGFTFSVATPSSGTFTGYTAGDEVTGPVVWNSGTVTTSGSVTFNKTVYLDRPRVSSGQLSDTAVLTGSGGAATAASSQASASTTIEATSLVSLTIDKTIPDVLQGAETQTFDFKVWAQGSDTTGTPSDTASITFRDGETSKSVTVSGLAPGIYFVTEDPAAGWAVQPRSADVDLSVRTDGSLTCSGTVRFTNNFGPATARVLKVTVPAGSESGWTMCLQGPGTESLPDDKECVVTAANGEAPFTTALREGNYTITETQQAGWRLSGPSDCSFTVDYPTDRNRLFSCTLTNEELGRIIIDKVTDPANETQPFDFTLTGGPLPLNRSFSLMHNETYDSGYVRAGAGYAAAETVPSGWDQTLATCADGSLVGNISVSPGETVRCTFTNTKRGVIIVKKVTDPPTSIQSFAFTLRGGASALNQSFSLTGGGTRSSGVVLPGAGYAVAETVPDGWNQISATCNDGSLVGNINVSAGETVTCTFTNKQLGRIIVRKLTDPSNPTQSFAFTLRGGTSGLEQSFPLRDGQSHDSGYVEAGAGYAAAETIPDGWDRSSASCDDASPIGNINVSPGETVVCTFVNTERGLIIIKKLTVPAPATQPFAFTLGGGPSGLSQSFSLAGGETHESGFVKPGSGYAASETVPADWNQTSATCSDGSPVGNINVSSAEIVTCTFTNTAKPNGITLDKKVNGADHATIGDALLAHSGDPLTYTIVITNNGQIPLTIGVLSDSLYAGLIAACPQSVGSVLAPGTSFTCTYQVDAGDDAQNVAAVSAVDSLDRPVSDSDETFVDVIHPGILIDKTADPTSVSVSGPVTYTYVVTNTGDTALHGIVVTDDIIGEIGTIDSLEPGASETLTKTVDVDVDTPPTNVGKATGIDVLGKTVSDTDDATIGVVLGVQLANVPSVLPAPLTPLPATQPPVQAPSPVAPLAELPRTGAPIGSTALVAFILLQVGLAFQFIGRRRRRLHPHSS